MTSKDAIKATPSVDVASLDTIKAATDGKKLKLSDIRLIDPHFIHSMRYQGIKDTEAIKELIDNSFDAHADNVNVDIWLEPSGSISIAIQDDGLGMDKTKLAHCLSFGFTDNAPMFGRIGRFGFGMSTAILCKTKNAEVYSSKGHHEYMGTYMDVDELSKADMMLPEPDYMNPFEKYGDRFKKFEKGTIVVLLNCDRVDFKKPDTVIKHLKEDLGETYRYFIEKGKCIKVNNQKVEIVDPMMRMKEHKYRMMLLESLKDKDLTEERGYSEAYGTFPFEVDFVNDKGEKVTSTVTVKPYLLPIEDIYRTAPTAIAAAKKYGIKSSKQGFYLMRNGRQIASGDTFNIYERHAALNYFRCEVEFNSELDEEFGIQTNKSRFNLSESIRDKIEDAVHPYLSITRRSYEKSEKKKSKIDTPGPAEVILKKNLAVIPEYISRVTPEVTEKAIKETIEEIKKNEKIDETEKVTKIETLEKAKEESLPYVFDYEYNPRGPIFNWDTKGTVTRIIINREHPFCKYYWDPSKDDQYQRALIKFLIQALVLGEQQHRYRLEKGLQMSETQLHNIWAMQLRELLESGEFTALTEAQGKHTSDVMFTDANGEVKS